MIEMRRILCPIDFSRCSRRALDHAAAVARWYDATVTLFHVTAAPTVSAYTPASLALPSVVLTSADRDALLATMKAFAEHVAISGVRLQFQISEGHAANEIVATAGAMPSDLIVIGTHGHSGFERLLLGSVDDKVMRRARCPVLSVPLHEEEVPAVPVLVRHVLCALDFSECSLNALTYARALAQAAGARLTVLHAIEWPTDLPPDLHENMLAGPRSLNDYVNATEAYHRERLLEAVPESASAPGMVDTVLAKGKAHREILRVAAERHSDLVVVGIHGRGIRDLGFLGSTAQHVVRQATCPVLTLRAA
jgi:nucleotide-binding universal stress UspA family protein